MRASLSGPKLVFDCSFDTSMSYEETKLAARQLHFCYGLNRRHKTPFDMHLCNVDLRGNTFKELQQFIPNVLGKKCLLSIHEDCFLHLFPKERFIYLSPDSDNELSEYNADDIFIVGTIVDKGPCQKLSLAQARRLGVRHARIPTDKYVRLASGAGKRFTLMAMTGMLLEWTSSQNWKKAFKHIERELAEPIEWIGGSEDRTI